MELIAPHAREECRRLLMACTDRPFSLRGTNPVIGRIAPTTVRLRKRIAYRNSFQTNLSAKMVEQGGQTLLRCRFAPHPLVTAFAMVWFAVTSAAAFLISGSALWMLAANPSAATSAALLPAMVPLGMLAAGAGVVMLGRYLARDERRFLIAFLRTALQARAAS